MQSNKKKQKMIKGKWYRFCMQMALKKNGIKL